jgi:integrase
VVLSELKKLKLKNQASGDTVFQNKVGGDVNMSLFVRDVFHPVCKDAGLKRTRLHDLRHTYISLLIERTQDIYYAQQQAGHHSIIVTCDRYGHLLNDTSKTRKVDILDEVATG